MSAAFECSILPPFLSLLEEQASSRASGRPPGDDDLDAMIALALTCFGELGGMSQRASLDDVAALTSVRELYAKYFRSCQPLLRLVNAARNAGVEPRRLNEFMSTMGEARLIGFRQQEVETAEREADAGSTRSISEIRDELQGRIRGLSR